MMGAFMRKNSWHRKTAAALVCTTLMTSLSIWPVLAEDEDLNNQLNTVQQQMQVESTKRLRQRQPLALYPNSFIKLKTNWRQRQVS